MKTNVVMNRKMGEFNIRQRTKDGMFNATELLNQWNNINNTGKKLDHFFENKSTKEFINTIIEDENLHTCNSVYVKSRASRGDNAGTWMHPFLYIDFCMWLNPKFKLTVIKFVYDELIKYRHTAGDNYRALSSSGSKIKGYDFTKVAKAIQWIVFNKTGKNLRQTANQTQLKEISDIEQKLSFAVDMGYIKSFTELMATLRKMWNEKYNQIAA